MSFYHENEAKKAKSFEEMRKATNPEDILFSMKSYVKTQYYQSKEYWENNNKSGHPNFETYFTHWIYSSLNSISQHIDVNKFKVIEKVLKSNYQEPTKSRLPSGSKYFE